MQLIEMVDSIDNMVFIKLNDKLSTRKDKAMNNNSLLINELMIM